MNIKAISKQFIDQVGTSVIRDTKLNATTNNLAIFMLFVCNSSTSQRQRNRQKILNIDPIQKWLTF